MICEVTPIGLLTYFVKVFSLTERTEFTEPFGARFEPTEGLRHTENTERFSYRRYRKGGKKQPTSTSHGYLGDYSPSLWGRGRGRGRYLSGLCVFCSSVFFCEKKNIFETRWGVFSLTELTDLTELFHPRFELTERLRHTEFTERYC